MTVRVTVHNHDKSLRIDVAEVEYTKGQPGSKEVETITLEPGESRDFYIHALRDLRVSETHAQLQQRPASGAT